MSVAAMHEMPGHLIRRAHQISGAIFAAHLAGFDLTSVQYAAMEAIAAQPGIDATRLSDLIAAVPNFQTERREDGRVFVRRLR